MSIFHPQVKILFSITGILVIHIDLLYCYVTAWKIWYSDAYWGSIFLDTSKLWYTSLKYFLVFCLNYVAKLSPRSSITVIGPRSTVPVAKSHAGKPVSSDGHSLNARIIKARCLYHDFGCSVATLSIKRLVITIWHFTAALASLWNCSSALSLKMLHYMCH